MAMVVVDDSSLQAESPPKLDGLVRGSAAAWRCSTFIKWTEWTLAMTLCSWRQHYKCRLGIVIIIFITVVYQVTVTISLCITELWPSAVLYIHVVLEC